MTGLMACGNVDTRGVFLYLFVFLYSNKCPPTHPHFLFCLFSVQETKKQKYKKNNARPTERPRRNEDINKFKKQPTPQTPHSKATCRRKSFCKDIFPPSHPYLRLSFLVFPVFSSKEKQRHSKQQTIEKQIRNQESRKWQGSRSIQRISQVVEDMFRKSQ
jgi:hypothetical protein